MELGKDLNGDKYMFLGKERNAEEMLRLYIFNYMKKRELHESAKTFAEEANIEMSDLDYDESLLKDWWDVFWPRYCSRVTKQPLGHPQSSSQSSMKEALEMLGSLISPKVVISQKPPTGNPPQQVNNVVGQPPDGMSQTAQGISQQRAGKHPMNTDTTSILGHLAASAKGKAPLSHLQMPFTSQPSPQVVRAYRPVKLDPTYPEGQHVAYPPAAPIAGENNWKSQGSSTGVRVNAPDGPDPDSYTSQVPAAFLSLMQQEAEEHKQ